MTPDVARSVADGQVFEAVAGPGRHGVTVAWARQDLDMATAARAYAELADLLSAGDGPDCVLVHLGLRCFVDLHGLRVLADVAELVRSRGGTLVVVAPPRSLTTMLTVTGFDARFALAASVRHASALARHRTLVSVDDEDGAR